MSIPDFQSIMRPLLRFYADGKEHSVINAVDYLGKEFKLTEQELSELIPSGKQPSFYNRVGWARTHLTRAKLLELTHRPYYKITDRGIGVLQENPQKLI
ncbi:MAG: hypothetical protein Fur0022_27230 [Anaerolineales bacterium]